LDLSEKDRKEGRKEGKGDQRGEEGEFRRKMPNEGIDLDARICFFRSKDQKKKQTRDRPHGRSVDLLLYVSIDGPVLLSVSANFDEKKERAVAKPN